MANTSTMRFDIDPSYLESQDSREAIIEWGVIQALSVFQTEHPEDEVDRVVYDSQGINSESHETGIFTVHGKDAVE